MKILVTGANGYIGAKVVAALIKTGHEVVCVDVSGERIDKRAKFICGDIFSGVDLYAEAGKPDICLHLAWRDGFIHNSPKHMGDLSAHFAFLTSMADAGVKQLAVMGTMHETGYYVGAVDENTPCRPMSMYGIAKNALREAMALYCKDKCVFQWLRAFYLYGDDEYGNSIFAKILRSARQGVTSFPLNSGKNKCDFLHVDVLSDQIARCVSQSEITGIINCCSGKAVALSEQIEQYIRDNGLSIKPEYGKYPDRPYDSPCIYGDNAKIARICGRTEIC